MEEQFLKDLEEEKEKFTREPIKRTVNQSPAKHHFMKFPDHSGMDKNDLAHWKSLQQFYQKEQKTIEKVND